MSIEAGNPTPKGTEEQNVAHSGKLGYERPVNEYKMPLEDALREDPNRGVAPDDASELQDDAQRDTSDRTTPWYKRRVTLVGGAVASLLAAGLTIGGIAATSGNGPDKQPVATGEANPEPEVEEPVAPAPEAPVEEPEAPTVEFDPTVLPASVVEMNLFNTLSPDSQARVLALDGMGIPEFRELPRGDELAYADYIIENNMPIVEYRLDNINKSYLYESANNDTAQGIVNANNLRYIVLSQLKTMSPETGIAVDLDAALKASAIVASEDPNKIQNVDALVSEYNINTPPDIAAKEATVTSDKVLEDGTWAINVTDSTGNYHTRYVKETFTAVDGTQKEIWTPILQVGETDPRYVNDLNNLT